MTPDKAEPEGTQLAEGMQVTDNVAASRYELEVDGDLVGIASYRLVDGAAVIHHTEISPRRQGNGLGAVLVGAALDDLRTRGLGVVPRCWYVGQFIDENPAYADMVAN